MKTCRCRDAINHVSTGVTATGYFVQNYKMVLVPMQDAGQFDGLDQMFKIHPQAQGMEADTLGCIADAQQGYALTGDETLFAQSLQRIVTSVVPGNHTQTGGAAVHGV
ncbi:hypothetical protein FACS1894182_10890 [Bacteroidia bacterium]|nr:hypothetical protein FACS1894182_10890 [Bacteroidia bacterium]